MIDYKAKANIDMGTILRIEFLEKYGISYNYLAHQLRVGNNRISEIVSGKRAITADTDVRLCKFFRLKSGYFLHKLVDLQLKYAQEELQDKIKPIKNFS